MYEDEITLKELILSIQEFSKEVLKNWKIILAVALVMIGIFVLRAHFTPVTYKAELTFMVNEDGGSMNGVNAILGQFGFGGGKTSSNLKKILKLSQSKKIIQEVLFKRVKLSQKDGFEEEDFLANHIIRLYDFHEKWSEDETGMANFFFTKSNIKEFSRTENRALGAVFTKVVGKEDIEGLFETSYSEETGIMNLTVMSESELMSIFLTKYIFESLSVFYVTKTIEKQQQTFDIFNLKADSISTELRAKEIELANFRDRSFGTLMRKDKVKEQLLQRDIQILTLLYGEVLKNLEIADFSLKNKTPFIQEIDIPTVPIKGREPSKVMAVIFGFLFGTVIGIIAIVFRKIYQDAML